MSVSETTKDVLINRCVEIPGYESPVSYDSNHKSPQGYLLCKKCAGALQGKGKTLHTENCPIKNATHGAGRYGHPNMIFVLGPNQTPSFEPFPFKSEDLEKIMRIAKEATEHTCKLPASVELLDGFI